MKKILLLTGLAIGFMQAMQQEVKKQKVVTPGQLTVVTINNTDNDLEMRHTFQTVGNPGMERHFETIKVKSSFSKTFSKKTLIDYVTLPGHPKICIDLRNLETKGSIEFQDITNRIHYRWFRKAVDPNKDIIVIIKVTPGGRNRFDTISTKITVINSHRIPFDQTLPGELLCNIIAQAGNHTEVIEMMQTMRPVNRCFKNLVEQEASYIIKSCADNQHKNKMWIISKLPAEHLSQNTQSKLQKWNEKGKALMNFVGGLKEYDPAVAISYLKNQLENGADVNYQDNLGFIPVMIAARNGHYGITQFLLEYGANPCLQTLSRLTALHFAVENGNEQIIKELLNAGVNVNAVNGDGVTVLSCAAKSGRKQVVKRLLQAGAKVDATDKKGMTALMAASNSETAFLLLEYGADFTLRAKEKPFWGWNALFFASKNGKTEVVRLLLEKGLHPDSSNGSDGERTLILAAQMNQKEIVRLLIAYGANPLNQAFDGEIALDYAKAKGFAEVVSILEPVTKKAIEAFKAKNGFRWGLKRRNRI